MFTPVIDLEVLNRATTLRFFDITGEDTIYATAGTGWDGTSGVDSTDISAAYLVVTDPNGDSTTLDCSVEILAADPIEGDEQIQFNDITGEWVDGYYSVEYQVWQPVVAIADISDYSGTVAATVKVHAIGHGLVTGMKVAIIGTAGLYDITPLFYDGTYIDVDNFYISATFVGNDTGDCIPIYVNTYAPFVYANAEIAIDKMYAIFTEMDEGTEADEYLKQVELANGLLNALKSAITTTTVARVNNIYGRITRILDFNSMDLTFS